MPIRISGDSAISERAFGVEAKPFCSLLMRSCFLPVGCDTVDSATSWVLFRLVITASRMRPQSVARSCVRTKEVSWARFKAPDARRRRRQNAKL